MQHGASERRVKEMGGGGLLLLMGFSFHVRKLEAGVLEGIHIHAPHWKKKEGGATRFQFSDMKVTPIERWRNEKPSLLSASHMQKTSKGESQASH